MSKNTSSDLPLIYSCSGCSNIAQLANQVAIELFHEGQAEMSCIAGVGGGVEALVRLARSGRDIVALDGCQLHCVKNCLSRQEVEATHHYTLTDYGIKKRAKLEFSPLDVTRIKAMVADDLDRLPAPQPTTQTD